MKTIALVMGCCRRFLSTCVALYSATCNLKINHDAIIYEYGMNENQKDFLRKVFNAKIIHYETLLEQFRNARLTHLAYSKYECFNLLSDYEQILWIDHDTVCNGNIEDIFLQKNGLVARREHSYPLVKEFKVVPDIFRNKSGLKTFNSGVLIFNRGLPKSLAELCYKATLEQGNNVNTQDQGILNLVVAQNDIEVTDLPSRFNLFPGPRWGEFDVGILHFVGEPKPWKIAHDTPITRLANSPYHQWIPCGKDSWYPEALEVWHQWESKTLKLLHSLAPDHSFCYSD